MEHATLLLHTILALPPNSSAAQLKPLAPLRKDNGCCNSCPKHPHKSSNDQPWLPLGPATPRQRGAPHISAPSGLGIPTAAAAPPPAAAPRSAASPAPAARSGRRAAGSLGGRCGSRRHRLLKRIDNPVAHWGAERFTLGPSGIQNRTYGPCLAANNRILKNSRKFPLNRRDHKCHAPPASLVTCSCLVRPHPVQARMTPGCARKLHLSMRSWLCRLCVYPSCHMSPPFCTWAKGLKPYSCSSGQALASAAIVRSASSLKRSVGVTSAPISQSVIQPASQPASQPTQDALPLLLHGTPSTQCGATPASASKQPLRTPCQAPPFLPPPPVGPKAYNCSAGQSRQEGNQRLPWQWP
jgi:hypothetical protein